MTNGKRPVERISTAQLAVVTSAVWLGTVFLPITSIMTRLAGCDAWLALVVATPLNLLLVWLAARAIFVAPRKPLVAQFELVLGRIPGRILAFPIGLALVAFCAGLARQIADVHVLSLLPRTPIWVFVFCVLLLSAILAREGIEVFARFVTVIYPVILSALVLMVAITAPDMILRHFLPILENGVRPVLRGIARTLPFVGEPVLVIWAVLPSVNQPRGGPQAMVRGGMPTLLVLLALNVATVGVFGGTETARLFYATIDLARYIQIGTYVRGLDVLVTATFAAASVMKITAFLLAGTKIVSECLGLADYRPAVIVTTVLCLPLALLLPTAGKMLAFLDLLDWYVMMPGLGMAVLIGWLVSRKQRAKRKQVSSA